MALLKNHRKILCGTVDSLALCLDSKQVRRSQRGTASVLSILQYASAVPILAGLHLQYFVIVNLTRILDKREYEKVLLVYLPNILHAKYKMEFALCDLRAGCCVFCNSFDGKWP